MLKLFPELFFALGRNPLFLSLSSSLTGPARNPLSPLPRGPPRIIPGPAPRSAGPNRARRRVRSVRTDRSTRPHHPPLTRRPHVSSPSFNRSAVLSLGRAARLRFLRTASPRPSRLQLLSEILSRTLRAI